MQTKSKRLSGAIWKWYLLGLIKKECISLAKNFSFAFVVLLCILWKTTLLLRSSQKDLNVLKNLNNVMRKLIIIFSSAVYAFLCYFFHELWTVQVSKQLSIFFSEYMIVFEKPWILTGKNFCQSFTV